MHLFLIYLFSTVKFCTICDPNSEISFLILIRSLVEIIFNKVIDNLKVRYIKSQ